VATANVALFVRAFGGLGVPEAEFIRFSLSLCAGGPGTTLVAIRQILVREHMGIGMDVVTTALATDRSSIELAQRCLAVLTLGLGLWAGGGHSVVGLGRCNTAGDSVTKELENEKKQ